MKNLVALCFQLALADGKAPEWMELIPAPNAQGKITGIDGRHWTIKEASHVAQNFQLNIPIDQNHATEIAAPKGEPSPASGWVEQLEVRQGAVWGRIAWTDIGRNSVESKQYRYLSPAFDYDSAGNVMKLVSVALTNKPNFNLALNSADPTEPRPMIKLLAALGLAATATEDEGIVALVNLKSGHTTALNAAQTPDVNKFVPRAEFDRVQTALNSAQKSINDGKQASLDAEIDTEVKSAMAAGKVAPASEKYFRAMCAQEGGLAQFREFIKTAVPVLDPKAQANGVPPGHKTALNAEQKAVMTSLGLTEEQFRKANGLDTPAAA